MMRVGARSLMRSFPFVHSTMGQARMERVLVKLPVLDDDREVARVVLQHVGVLRRFVFDRRQGGRQRTRGPRSCRGPGKGGGLGSGTAPTISVLVRSGTRRRSQAGEPIAEHGRA